MKVAPFLTWKNSRRNQWALCTVTEEVEKPLEFPVLEFSLLGVRYVEKGGKSSTLLGDPLHVPAGSSVLRRAGYSKPHRSTARENVRPRHCLGRRILGTKMLEVSRNSAELPCPQHQLPSLLRVCQQHEE